MSEATAIQWTDHTFNPWWGCARVSPGCEHCYAEKLAARFGTEWGTHASRRFFGDRHWRKPLTWNRKAERDGVRRRVFCASMADVFERLPMTHPQVEEMRDARNRLGAIIRSTPMLDWLLLTKRPERIVDVDRQCEMGLTGQPNVWLGTTAENQKRAGERVPDLLRAKASLRAPVAFVSYEPGLGPVDFRPWLQFGRYEYELAMSALDEPLRMKSMPPRPRLDWLIIGGEFGPNARPFNIERARSAIRQCRDAGVAAFVKQLGAVPYQSDWVDLDWPAATASEQLAPGGGSALRARLRDKRGGDPSEWPADLRVREFPR